MVGEGDPIRMVGRGGSHEDGWGRGDPIRMVGGGGSHKDGWGEGGSN